MLPTAYTIRPGAPSATNKCLASAATPTITVTTTTGYVYDTKRLSDLIKREVLNRYDHQNLNLDTEEFRTLNPTAENIAVVIWQRLRANLEAGLALSVTLYETDRNFVEYHG